MLALVPVGFLVLIILGAIAVDSANLFLAQRQLSDALAAAASDASTAGLSNQAFYTRGQVLIDPRLAAPVVCQAVAAQSASDLRDVHLFIAVTGPVIEVRGTANVDAVFGRALPGVGRQEVQAAATAVASGGGGTGGGGGATPGPAPFTSLPAPAPSDLEPLIC
ncbi:MAG: hypothetical protein ACYC1D_05205 [Acidimicrobiales bacterium]